MKAKDLGIIFVVAVVSGVISILLSGTLFSNDGDRKQNVEVVEKIQTNFPTPDVRYFNQNSINPAQDIRIGQDPNSNPFESR